MKTKVDDWRLDPIAKKYFKQLTKEYNDNLCPKCGKINTPNHKHCNKPGKYKKHLRFLKLHDEGVRLIHVANILRYKKQYASCLYEKLRGDKYNDLRNKVVNLVVDEIRNAKCKGCGKPIETLMSLKERSQRVTVEYFIKKKGKIRSRFCNKECRVKYHVRASYELKCLFCGKIFRPFRNHKYYREHGRGHSFLKKDEGFCNQDCYIAYITFFKAF